MVFLFLYVLMNSSFIPKDKSAFLDKKKNSVALLIA